MTSALPPYPRLGECVSAIVGALDIKKVGSDVGRLAREGDFDWEKLDAVIQTVLLEGTERYYGKTAHKLVLAWFAEVKESYCHLLLDVTLDSVGRDDTLPILIEDFFIPFVAQFLLKAQALSPGPDLSLMLSTADSPLAVVFGWLDGYLQGPTEKLLYPESTGTDRTDREKVSKWRNGIDLPSAQGIKLFSQRVLDVKRDSTKGSTAALWLMIATALTRFERDWSRPVRPLIIRGFERSPTDHAVQDRLWELVGRVGHSWPELAEPGRKLWYELRRTSSKQAGDQQRTRDEISKLEARAAECDPNGLTAYHYEWMRARWHTLSGQYQDALPYYQRAFELASYRVGRQIKDLIEESACVAGFLAKKNFLKQLKHVGITLGLFRKPASGNGVLDEWEIEQFVQMLPRIFPTQGRFVECEPDLSELPAPGLMAISKETVEELKIDLKKLDRVRSVQFASGEVRRWPQLRLFASFGQASQVKALLDAGAPVDDLDSSGASALLCALQYAEATGNRDVLDLLLVIPHQVATINAMTHKKRLTPLMCAIDLGAPDVVRALLDQKADKNQHALTDNQTPLYYLVSQLFFKVNPNRLLEKLTLALLTEPDLVQQDTMRRFGVGFSGTFGNNTDLVRAKPELALATARSLVNLHTRRHTVAKLTEIAAILLEFKADPNAPHRYPVPGRTPLMLAAESDLPEVFDQMMQHGGDPLRPDAAGQNCMQIAASFRSVKIMDYLRSRGF